MNIKAIETTYKGYKFRSRLEARYAVFFDKAGIDWQYEVEGFELPSGRYLPDFILPQFGMHVEIKPPPFTWVARPKIYMAGRMGKQTSYRPFDIELPRDLLLRTRLNGAHISYTGPFRDTSDHGMLRRHEGCCSDSLDNIFNRSVFGINRCDIFFAMFDDLEAYGTLVELGMAKHAKKRIIVGLTQRQSPPLEYDDESNDSDPQDDCFEGRIGDHRDNLWFAIHAAEKCLTGTREEILQQLSDLIKTEYPLSAEHTLAMELSEHSNLSIAAICYGDPVNAFVPGSGDGGIIEFHNGTPLEPNRSVLFRDYSKFREAALSARQARFEHGQNGAS